MAAVLENVRSERAFDPDSRYGIVSTPERESQGRVHPLDSDYYRKLHGRLLAAWNYERRRQFANRYQMALDWDYYDGIQLTEEDIQILEARGQSPLVFNLIKRTVDWVIGTERRTRIDFRVVGRENDDTNVATIKTKYLKYLNDVNKTPFHRSRAFKEASICGLGWLEDGAREDPTKEPIYSRAETWKNMLHDSLATELDLSDARWIFRQKWVDTDIAIAICPDRRNWLVSNQDTMAAEMQEAELAGEWYLGNRLVGEDYKAGSVGKHAPWGQPGLVQEGRDRVRLIEAWFRNPTRTRYIRGGEYNGQPMDPSHIGQARSVMDGMATIIDKIEMKMFVAVMTESVLLFCGQSPYKHDQTPFTPIWCYRRGRDNLPYGLVRNLRDPQDDFNRRMSKALFALSSYRIRATADAVDPKIMDWDELREEAGRPDALLVHRRGSTLEVDQDRGLGEAHLGLADRDAAHILDASGVTRDNLGLNSNAKSGIAIQAKQQEGAAVTTEIFDNLRMAAQWQGEKQISLSEQFATQEKVFRITNTRGMTDYVRMNVPEIQPDGSVRIKDDITATKADFIVDQQDFNTSLRDAASQQMMELAGRMQDPMIALQVMDMAVSASNIPQKDEITGRIRKITGMEGDPSTMTDAERAEAEKAQAEKQAQMQKQAQAQEAAFMAELEVKRATAEKLSADAERALADAEKLKAEAMTSGEDTSAISAAEDQAKAAVEQANAKVKDLEGQIGELQAAMKAAAADRVAERDHEMQRVERELAVKKDTAIEVAKINAAAKAESDAKSKEDKDDKKESDDLSALMQTVQSIQMAVESLEKGGGKAAASPVTLSIGDAATKGIKDGMKEVTDTVSGAATGLESAAKGIEKAVSGVEKAAEKLAQAGDSAAEVSKAVQSIASATKAIEGAAKAMADAAKVEAKEEKSKPTTKEITLPDGRKVIIRTKEA